MVWNQTDSLQVRAVTFPKADEAITCSRDGTVRRWMRQSIEPPIFDASVCLQANGHVQTVAYLPPSATYPEGLIFSGGQDTVIEARKPESAPQDNAEALLLGHAHNVCALDVDPTEKLLVSGSWDKDARLWTLGKWETDVTLRGHEGSVWATLIYDSNTIITGCADTKIRVFSRQGKLLRTISASQDPVRALCKLPQGHASGADFASAGNDSFVRLWTLAGHQLASLQGHDSFIYSLSVTPDGHLVSCGEDRTLRIWQGTECIQTITHPATSVWSVAVCSENGDLITGASDRMARIFTRDPKRYASTQDMEQFEEAVRGSSIPQQALEQKINKEQLPGPDFLQQKKGTKEGQVQMIVQSDGAVTAHTWSAGAWVNVGTVVDAVGSSGKKVPFTRRIHDSS